MGDDFDYSIQYTPRHPSDPHAVEAEIEARRRHLAPLVAGVEPRTALDLGCGTGLSVAALGRLGFDAIGIERDPRLAATGAQRGLAIIESDDLLGAVRNRVAALGLVLMYDVLEHVPPDQQLVLLRGVREALVTGGVLLVKVPNASSPVAAHRRYGDWTHTSSFTVDSLEFLLRNAGFSAIAIQKPAVARRPPIRLWRPAVRAAFWRWVVVKGWERVLQAQLWSEVDPADLPPITADFVCAARAVE